MSKEPPRSLTLCEPGRTLRGVPHSVQTPRRGVLTPVTPTAQQGRRHLSAALAAAVLAVSAWLLLASGSAQAVPALTYGCSPPTPGTEASCNDWHRGPVTLTWDWDTINAEIFSGDCGTQIFSKDTAAQEVSCTVRDKSDMTTTGLTVFVHVDATPPVVTAAVSNRGPDYNGWWNHPLGYTFTGTDATSGLNFCTPIAFAGPGSQVVGTCQDKAGNVGTGTFTVPFDSTPPDPPKLKLTPGNGGAIVSWQNSGGAVQSEVVRAPVPGEAAGEVVYTGPANRFEDSGLTNGDTYRYTVTAFDQADNTASAAASVTPDASIGLVPAIGARLRHRPMLSWPRMKSARYYNVQLFRGKQKLLTRWPGHAHFKLDRSWTFNGHQFRLRPGKYRWYVWPGLGSRKAHKYGTLIGRSTFVIIR